MENELAEEGVCDALQNLNGDLDRLLNYFARKTPAMRQLLRDVALVEDEFHSIPLMRQLQFIRSLSQLPYMTHNLEEESANRCIQAISHNLDTTTTPWTFSLLAMLISSYAYHLDNQSSTSLELQHISALSLLQRIFDSNRYNFDCDIILDRLSSISRLDHADDVFLNERSDESLDFYDSAYLCLVVTVNLFNSHLIEFLHCINSYPGSIQLSLYLVFCLHFKYANIQIPSPERRHLWSCSCGYQPRWLK